MHKISWYLKRLKVMGFREVLYRIHEQLHIIYYRIQYHYRFGLSSVVKFNVKNFSFTNSNVSCLPDLSWEAVSDSDKNKIIDGKICFAGEKWLWEGDDKIWFQSQRSNTTWPKLFFSSINYRHGNKYGDVRVVWELSRLQQLVDAALLSVEVDEKTSANLISSIENQLDSWVKMNPPLCGVNYISSMECALRILSVCHSIDMVRDRLGQPDRTCGNLLYLVWSHASFIEKRLSLYSSAGNHTIAECAGLIFAGVLFPEFNEAKRWRQTGEKIFFKEIKRQIYSDGGGLEQTLWYHVFVLDLLGLVIKLYDYYSLEIEADVIDLYDKGCGFVNTFSSCVENLPAIGDSDNGYALSRYLNITWSRSFTNDGLFIFKEAGYTVFNDNHTNLSLVFDHGPLGMPPSYGHGHADALSIIFRYKNNDVLIDPGTYTYTSDAVWRKYFRGTKAHNTVVINGLDQSVQESAFLWSKPYFSDLVAHEQLSNGIIRLLAYHDGYISLGIKHWRGVVIFPDGNLLVWDHLVGVGDYNIELNWHIAGQVQKLDNRFNIINSSDCIALQVEGGESHLCNGDISPICGWQSPGYGTKQPTTTIGIKSNAALPVSFVTIISIDGTEINDEVKRKEISILQGWIS